MDIWEGKEARLWPRERIHQEPLGAKDRNESEGILVVTVSEQPRIWLQCGWAWGLQCSRHHLLLAFLWIMFPCRGSGPFPKPFAWPGRGRVLNSLPLSLDYP